MGIDILAYITDIITLLTDVIAIFMQPPLVWFVVIGFVGAGVGIVRKLIPSRRR